MERAPRVKKCCFVRVAAATPVLVGAVYDASGGWQLPLLVLAALVALVVALLVSQAGQVYLDDAINAWNSFALWFRGLLQ